MLTNRLHGYVLFNFLAKDEKNLEDVLEAGKGFIIPGITAADHEISDAVHKIHQFKKMIEIVSVGLGGNGNVDNWKKTLEIAVESGAGHINQPFETASYARGYVAGKQKQTQWINALVSPSGRVGTVRLSSGKEVKTEWLVDVIYELGIPSIKLMPVKGITHLEELVHLTKIAAKKGIRAIEPAGGISKDNIKDVLDGVKNTGIELFIPHIFGSTIHPNTKETIPEEVATILKRASE